MKQILKIAIPNGMENGVFQLVKVALSSIVALFGTYQIAANGVAQSIWSLAALAGVAMGPVFITVIGQCMGNGDTDAADHYFKRLTRITLLISSAWNLLIFLLTPFFMKFYALQPETKRLVIWLVLIHNVFNAAAYPFSGALSNKAKYTKQAEDIRESVRVLKEKLTEVLENRSERNRWISQFTQFSTLETLDRRALIHMVQSIRVRGKKELDITFTHEDEYKKALQLLALAAQQKDYEQRKVG